MDPTRNSVLRGRILRLIQSVLFGADSNHIIGTKSSSWLCWVVTISGDCCSMSIPSWPSTRSVATRSGFLIWLVRTPLMQHRMGARAFCKPSIPPADSIAFSRNLPNTALSVGSPWSSIGYRNRMFKS